MDKVNIVSSQINWLIDWLYSKCPPLARTHARCLPRHWSITWSKINCSRPRWAAVSIHRHCGFVCGRHDATWQSRYRNPQDWDLGCLEAIGWAQESLAFLDAAVQLLRVCRARSALSCWNAKLISDTAYRWQQYDVIMTSWSSIDEVSKRYHQNFLLCNNNEITACIADLFNSCC